MPPTGLNYTAVKDNTTQRFLWGFCPVLQRHHSANSESTGRNPPFSHFSTFRFYWIRIEKKKGINRNRGIHSHARVTLTKSIVLRDCRISEQKIKNKRKKVCDINKQKPFRMRLSSETARSSVSDQNKRKSKCQKDRGMAQIFAYDNEQCHRPIRTEVDRNAPSLKDKCSLKLVQNGIKAAVSERQQPKRRPHRRHRPTERNRCWDLPYRPQKRV